MQYENLYKIGSKKDHYFITMSFQSFLFNLKIIEGGYNEDYI